MIELPAHLKEYPVVNAAVTVANNVQQFRIASMLEGLCKGNPNIGKPGAGRFDMKNVSIEVALEDEGFIEAVRVLERNRSQAGGIPRILSALYEIAPQVQETYQP